MEPRPSKPEDRQGANACPVVAVGASAGGLEAYKSLLRTLPSGTGAAYIFVQHLDPEHDSLMAPLLGKCTEMPVMEIRDGEEVSPNQVYTLPPNRSLTIENGVLHLDEPVEHRGVRMPIDHFFRSLAADAQEKSIAIVLSGTGTDGSLGLKAIKEAGGLTIVQQPDTAAYDGMPNSAIGTHVADYITPIEDMTDVLKHYIGHSYVQQKPYEKGPGRPNALADVLSVLHVRTGYDFRNYKESSVIRRIHRRMGMNSVEDIKDYVDYLRSSTEEPYELVKDILICVTRFFRDPDAMQALRETAIASLAEQATADAPLRIWLPACATGEEAYSIAILFLEEFEKQNKVPFVQIFATDISKEALDVARSGEYPESISADVPVEFLKKYFTKAGHDYVINKSVRDIVVFAQQNLISDPPFSKLHLISCRNILIYLNTDIQKKLLSLFHFALLETGYLYLGTSETIGRQHDIFEPLSKPYRIYTPKNKKKSRPPHLPFVEHNDRRSSADAPRVVRKPREERNTIEKLLLERYAPAAVLVDVGYEVRYFYGPTDIYLSQPTGEPTRSVLDMARYGLRSRLRGAIYTAQTENTPVSVDNVRIRGTDRKNFQAYLTVSPVLVGGERMFLITFEQSESRLAQQAAKSRLSEIDVTEETIAKQLEQELHTTREDLQTTVEELEASNEELRSSNEEVMSMNEELQSTNEELETSKEELQSLNEELTTVNTELQDKVSELEASSNDFYNLLASTDIATVFIDTHLRVKRFTPTAQRVMNLIENDIGRPLRHISLNVGDKQLFDDITKVFSDFTPIEAEVRSTQGQWYLRRVRPYLTMDNEIEGAVITYSDVTDLKNAERNLKRLTENLERTVAERTTQLKRSEAHWTAFIEATDMGTLSLDANGRILEANPAFVSFTGENSEQNLTGQNAQNWITDAAGDAWNKAIKDLAKSPKTANFETELTRKNGSPFPISVTMSSSEEDGKITILALCRDIRSRKTAETKLREAQKHAEAANEAKSKFLASMSHELRTPLNAIMGFAEIISAELLGKSNNRKYVEYGHDIYDSAAHLLSLINDILDLSMIEAGKRKIRRERLKAKSLLRDCLRMVRMTADKKKIELIADFPKKPVVINSDKRALKQIVFNLLSNAVKYTQPNGEVALRLRQTDEESITIEVIDNGAGIPKDQIERLFRPFEQLEQDPTKEFEGSGLGLAVVNDLVHMENGRFEIESEVGIGTTARVILPTH